MKFKLDLSKFKNLGQSFKSLKSFNLSKSLKEPKKTSNFMQKFQKRRAKSFSLNLSKRDSILLALLVLGVEGYGLYHMMLIPKWQVYSDLQTRYAAEQVIATNFDKDIAQKNQYLENLKLLDYKLGVLTTVIPTEIPQEEIVLTLNKLAKARELDLGGIAFSTISAVSKQDFAAGKTTSAQPQATNKVVTPTSVANDTSQGTASTSTANDSKTSQLKPKLAGNMVLVEDVNLAFSGSYGSLYNFISDLEKSEPKIIVKDLSLTRGEGDLLKGALKVQYVGYITPEDKSTYTLETPVISGKVSPFLPYLGFEDKTVASASTVSTSAQGPAPVKTYNPNFSVLLNTFDDNAPKIIMGDYTKNGTELYSNSNASIRGRLSISGNQDNMTYSYSLGGTTQTKNIALQIDGGKIRLKVISQPRKNEQDKVSLTLDVENKTDYPFEINVINDDLQAPRFSLGTQLGSVTVK